MTTERDSSAGEDAGGRSEAAKNRTRSPGKPVGEPGSSGLAETLIKPTAEPLAPPPRSGAGVATLPDEDVPAEWEPGMFILDTYEVKDELGRGSFGTVHKVYHKSWNVDLALKIAFALPFMPPEQARDVRTCQPTADVFAMGATLYWMLTARAIWDFSRNVNDAVLQVSSEPPVSIRTRDSSLTRQLAQVVDKALSVEPKARFPNAGSFAQAIRAFIK